MTYLCYLSLLAYSGDQHIIHLHLMYPMLPVSRDSPFLIVPSEFSNVYLIIFFLHTILFQFRINFLIPTCKTLNISILVMLL